MEHSRLVQWACGKLPLDTHYPATLHLMAAMQLPHGEQLELLRQACEVAAPPAVPVTTDDLFPWVQEWASQCAQLLPADAFPLCLCMGVSWVPAGAAHGFRARMEVGVDASGQAVLAPFPFEWDAA